MSVVFGSAILAAVTFLGSVEGEVRPANPGILPVVYIAEDKGQRGRRFAGQPPFTPRPQFGQQPYPIQPNPYPDGNPDQFGQTPQGRPEDRPQQRRRGRRIFNF